MGTEDFMASTLGRSSSDIILASLTTRDSTDWMCSTENGLVQLDEGIGAMNEEAQFEEKMNEWTLTNLLEIELTLNIRFALSFSYTLLCNL